MARICGGSPPVGQQRGARLWAPNGGISCSVGRLGPFKLFKMLVDGSEQQVLTKGPERDHERILVAPAPVIR